MTSYRRALRCKAKRSTDGEPCTAYAMADSEVCSAHGGRAPQVKAAARRRSLERQAAAELARLDVTPLDDPLSELALLAAQAVAWKNAIAAKVNELTSLRYEGEGLGEQLRAEVALWERALDRCERVLVAMARLNIDERLTAIAEHHVNMVMWLVSSTLARFGLDVGDEVVRDAVDGLVDRLAERGEYGALPSAVEAPGGPEMSYVCELGQHDRCRSYMPVDGLPEPEPWPERCPCGCHRPPDGT